MKQSAFIFDVTVDDFDTEVLEKSRHTLVVVDFWAAWCAPCRVLMPLLQQLAEEYQGRFLLAKVNSDEQQALAAQWGIRSLPAVKLFRDAQVVDEFLGAQPEPVIRSFLERYLPRESDSLREAARAALQNGDTEQALTFLQKALTLDPDRLAVKMGLATALMHRGDLDGVDNILRTLPLQEREEGAVKVLEAQLGFARAAQSAPSLAEMRHRLTVHEDDLQSRYALGASCAVEGDYDEALAQFFEIMKRDRRFNDDIGRRGLLAVFQIVGDDHELAQKYRRKMAPLLY